MDYAVYSESEEQFIVHNPKEVVQILNDLLKQKAMLKVSFNHGADEYLTTVIAVDVKTHTVLFDIGRDEDFNRRLLASHQVIFSKEDGIKIKWVSTHITEINLKDGKAIKIALPKDLLRLQRREFYRFTTPIVNPVLCRVDVPDEHDVEASRTLELTLADVSLGGVGVLTADPLDPALTLGAYLHHCKIGFPDVGETNLTLQVKNVNEVHVKEGVMKQRVGLQYIEPSRGNESLINRYVYILERQLIALANSK
ncbi:MAG: flagellar brake protein [Betaproteobacteria bacterium HGW-Betaproteobacteria-22]|nr:MAG: flagellar brake protein [Betaproteobacteria bacterium HGW-Betaproteobacteria-22]